MIKLDAKQRKRATELADSWAENENCDYDAIANEIIYLRDQLAKANTQLFKFDARQAKKQKGYCHET